MSAELDRLIPAETGYPIAEHVCDRLIEVSWQNKLWRPTVVAAIKNPSGQALLVSSKRVPGEWGLVQGGIDPKESARRAAFRETYEEVGIRAADLVVGGVTEVLSIGSPPRRGFRKGSIYFATQVQYVGTGELKLNEDELHDMGWFDPDEVSAKIAGKRPAKQGLIMRAITTDLQL